jgi:hypothetical protein
MDDAVRVIKNPKDDVRIAYVEGAEHGHFLNSCTHDVGREFGAKLDFDSTALGC